VVLTADIKAWEPHIRSINASFHSALNVLYGVVSLNPRNFPVTSSSQLPELNYDKNRPYNNLSPSCRDTNIANCFHCSCPQNSSCKASKSIQPPPSLYIIIRKPYFDSFPLMLIGYMRVSSNSVRQNTDLQRDALLAAGINTRYLLFR
jgi:hypothetical protein